MESVAVVIVSYNTRDVLRDCLHSVVRERPAQLIVADNGSDDGTLEMLEESFPTVTLDLDPHNPGYGAAANRGIRRCHAEYVLVLNSDTLLAPGALAALGNYLETHPRVALVGPRLRNPDGTLQTSCHNFPSPIVTLLEYSWLGHAATHVPILRARYLGAWAHDRARSVDWVTGAALAVKRSAMQSVGGFDERYFMYFEEVDLAHRLRAAGWEIHFAPVTDVTHLGGASTAKQARRMNALQFAAMAHYYRDHAPDRIGGARLALRFAMLMKLARHAPGLVVSRDPTERSVTKDNLRVWWHVLRHAFEEPSLRGGT